MAEWFAGQIMDKIINTCSQYLQDHFGSQTSMEKDLQRLRENHLKIQAVLSASRQAQIRDRNPALKLWIWQLRDAIDEADDLLDEFEYLEHKERLVRQNMEEKKARSAIASFFSESAHKVRRVCDRAFKSDSNLKNRLEEAVQKLDNVSDEVGTFLHLLDNIKHEQQAMEQQLCDDRASGSSPGLVFIGRGKEKEFVMQWLREPSNEHPTRSTGATCRNRISLLSIIGHGGMGKTTLLQEVFNDLEEEFDLKIWVCVSNNFKEEEVIADMLKYLDKWSSHLTKLPTLQERLKSTMQSKKFLLVMDDIWEENTTKWEKVLSPMANGKSGSKILITTRMDSAASMIPDAIITKKEILRLKGLEEVQCLELLKTHTFAGIENLVVDHKKLTCIAEKIVKKLSGSPLAAKVIGGILRYDLTPEHWERVLKTNIGSIELVPGQNTNTIMPILRLSYAFLSESIQNCFAFCSIFPQDHCFDKNDLVRMWIALSFIQSSSIVGESLEDIGARYFDILVRKSFFDEFKNNEETYYKMHDLLHELAQSVSTEECCRFVDNEGSTLKIPQSIRHLAVETTNLEVLRNIREVKNLHTFFITSRCGDKKLFDVLNEVLKASRNLRLMFISLPNLEVIPEAIESLVHLRYIKFLKFGAFMFPMFLCNLYHLQFIIFDDTWHDSRHSDEFVITNMSNLFNLRYLKLPKNFNDENGFRLPGIGKLSSLQVLDPFYVKDQNGYNIGELEHMNELRQLTIKFLSLIEVDKESCTAKLCDKKKLTNLSLNFPPRTDILDDLKHEELDEKVLDNLQPYNNLKRLSICSYLGASSAIWMYNADLISNLEYINLESCFKWKNLPPFGQLPFLKYLYLSSMSSAKRLDSKFHGTDKVSVFPLLEVLHMEKLEVLEDWFDVAGAAEDNCLFPCLTELFLINCPNLQVLPYLPPKLKKVKIEKIGWKALNWKQGNSNRCSISKSIPLETLEILCCRNLTSLPLADVKLEALRKLTIGGHPNLISLSGQQEVKSTENFQLILNELIINNSSVLLMEPLRSTTSIKKLTIEDNDELVSFPNGSEQWLLQVSSSLSELSFICLKSLQSLPSSLSTISSLRYLSLESIPHLKSLPDLPPSLYELYLYNLDQLDCLPSCLASLSSLTNIVINNAPQLRKLPDLPPSLSVLRLCDLDQLDCLPSCLASLSSLMKIEISKVPQLRELPDLPPSLYVLRLCDLDQLDCLPSCLASLSSLTKIDISNVPQLRELPDLPPSLKYLYLWNLDQPDCLPSCLASLSSLTHINIYKVPQLRELPDLPPSLSELRLRDLDQLDCLPSCLTNLSSLVSIYINNAPKLRELPDLPPSLSKLRLLDLDQLDCLPSCLASLSSLIISMVPQLRELPDLPPSLKHLTIQACHPELKERYEKLSGSDRHKVAHIPNVRIK